MLISIMYHHINSDRFSNNYDDFYNHLLELKRKCKIVFSGDGLYKFQRNICLVFDDAYYDFYYYVFPLLKQLNLKCILAVPVHYIVDFTTLPSAKRLNLKNDEMMLDQYYLNYIPFCTWEEINEVVKSGLVKIAAHGLKHKRLTQIDEEQQDEEIIIPKEIIEHKIGVKIDNFVLPHGNFNKKVLSKIFSVYKYCFAIRKITHLSWFDFEGLIFRFDGDNLNKNSKIISYNNYYKGLLRNLKSRFQTQ